MKNIFVTFLCMFLSISSSATIPLTNNPHAADGGIDIGSGGDLVKCKPGTDNNLFGLYSLDYLVFLSEEASPPEAVTSWEQSFFRIRNNLAEKVPELLKSFDEYSQDVFNTSYDRKHVWEPTDYELTELQDEELSLAVKIPENCRQDGKVQLVQAVIRQHEEFSGSKNIIFKYMPEATKTVNEQNPLQLSFLLVHEWLWSVSDNVDRNRRVNWYLHSAQFESDSKEDAHAKLTALGLSLEPPPLIVSQDGSGDYTSLQQAVLQAAAGSTLILKEGRYTLSGSVINLPLKIIGEGDAEKILIEGNSENAAAEINVDRDQSVYFQNIRFFRPYVDNEDMYDAVVKVMSGELTLKNCILGRITEDDPYPTTPIYANSANSKVKLVESLFGYGGYGQGYGILLEDRASVEFYGNQFAEKFLPSNNYKYPSDLIRATGYVAPREDFVFQEGVPVNIYFKYHRGTHFCQPDEVTYKSDDGGNVNCTIQGN